VVNVGGVAQCGTVTVVGSGILFDVSGEKTYYFINKIKKIQVESCDTTGPGSP
jgi:hypothetical protein